jgi:hypothetical protein
LSFGAKLELSGCEQMTNLKQPGFGGAIRFNDQGRREADFGLLACGCVKPRHEVGCP